MKRSLYEAAKYVIHKLESLGIKLHSQSRLMKMHDVLVDKDGVPRRISPDDSNFEVALEAIRDVLQFEFILDQIDVEADSRVFKKLRQACKDSALPQSDKYSTKGRNTQFELLICAICSNANLSPILFDEPDLTVHIGKQKFGIAAKRVKSRGNIENNIRKAANQISMSELPGVIALDTCELFNPENKRIISPVSDSRFEELHSEYFRRYLDEKIEATETTRVDSIRNWVRPKGVRGVIFHDHQVRQIAEFGWQMDSLTYSLPTAVTNPRRHREFQKFDKAYKSGLAT